MLQHTVNCHSLTNLSLPLFFIFCPLSLTAFFSELLRCRGSQKASRARRLGRDAERVGGVKVFVVCEEKKQRPVFFTSQKGKAGMAAVPAARRVKAILRRLPLGSDDVNKSLSGVRLGERQTESVSPLFSPR